MNEAGSPCVSVVIPAYGHRDFIAEAVESALSQSHAPLEVIVVNDGSPDDTAAVLSEYVRSGRIVYVEQQNAGQGSARNAGIALCRGQWIALLDDDDLWPADKLAWQVKALAKNPNAALVYGWPACIEESGARIEPTNPDGSPMWWPYEGPSGKVYEAFAIRSWIYSPGQALLRRSALESVTEPGASGPFDTSLWGTDDWDLWLRLAERWEFVFENRIGLHYRFHAQNAGRDELRMRLNAQRVYEKHFRRALPYPERTRALLVNYDNMFRDLLACLRRRAADERARGRVLAALRWETLAWRWRWWNRTTRHRYLRRLATA